MSAMFVSIDETITRACCGSDLPNWLSARLSLCRVYHIWSTQLTESTSIDSDNTFGSSLPSGWSKVLCVETVKSKSLTFIDWLFSESNYFQWLIYWDFRITIQFPHECLGLGGRNNRSGLLTLLNHLFELFNVRCQSATCTKTKCFNESTIRSNYLKFNEQVITTLITNINEESRDNCGKNGDVLRLVGLARSPLAVQYWTELLNGALCWLEKDQKSLM